MPFEEIGLFAEKIKTVSPSYPGAKDLFLVRGTSHYSSFEDLDTPTTNR